MSSNTERTELERQLERLEQQKHALDRTIADLRRRLGQDDDLVPLKRAIGNSGYHPESLRVLVVAGRVRGARVGGRWLASACDFERYLQNRRTEKVA